MPTNYERGAYEPSDEVRVFDGGEDEEDVEGSRLPLLIVIALLVLAAFGGVVWLAYQRGVQQGHAEVPRVIAAESGPVKTTPTNAGGTPTPYTGLKIYQQPAPSNEDADAVPPAKPAPVVATPAPAKPAAVEAPLARIAAAPPTTTPPPAVPPAAKPEPARIVVEAPLPAVVPPVAKPSAATPPPATPVVEAPTPAGTGLLQIGAYKSEAEANAAWNTYKAKHSSLLAGASPNVKQVDLGAKGTWYRLRVVTIGKGEAAALCEKLKTEGGACFPAK